jgi:hypothetical protein
MLRLDDLDAPPDLGDLGCWYKSVHDGLGIAVP